MLRFGPWCHPNEFDKSMKLYDDYMRNKVKSPRQTFLIRIESTQVTASRVDLDCNVKCLFVSI